MAVRALKNSKTSVGFLNPATVFVIGFFVLAVLGIIILFSASIPVTKDQPFHFVVRQSIWMGVAIILGYVIVKVDLESMRKVVWLGYACCILVLIAVLIPGIGSRINGSMSWFRLGPASFQPAEFAKVGLVFALAHYFSYVQKYTGEFRKGFVYPCLIISGVVGLILLQTDLGTAFIISLACLALLVLAGSNWVYILTAVTLAVGMVFVAVQYDPERLSRFTAFMDMEANKAGDAYQVYQSILAFGTGGIDGVGLGNGRQQLSSLPKAYNDFIFAILGEELGLFSTLAVVCVYLTIFLVGMAHLRKAPNMYQYMLAAGCLFMFVLQALVNIGVVTGRLPTTGLPLPLISYGGSGFLSMAIFMAILVNTHFAWKKPALKDSKRKMKEIRK